MKLKIGISPSISIDLEPGVYLLPSQSAIGKSYLCSAFRDLESIDRVKSHAFPAELIASQVFDSSKRDVVMLDRYDLCKVDYSMEMLDFAKTGVVLVDCKAKPFTIPCKPCRLYMTKDALVIK